MGWDGWRERRMKGRVSSKSGRKRRGRVDERKKGE